jgi:hypothetical protein
MFIAATLFASFVALPMAAQSRDTTFITAMDFAFRAPSTVSAGMHTFRMVNAGRQLHMIEFTRMDATHSAAQLLQIFATDPMPPKWAVDLGGPNIAAPGDTSNATLDLAPGRYMLTCWVPTPDASFHVMKGMYTTIEAKARKGSGTNRPAPNATIRLRDFKITFSRTPTRGAYTFRVDNDGPQEHDVQILRLNPGRSERETLQWMDSPAAKMNNMPAKPMGGMVGLNPGMTGYFSVAFTPGDYIVVCFVPDNKDSKPHYRHGMIYRFHVA